METVTYLIDVIESEDTGVWDRLVESLEWVGSTEPYWRDGEQLGRNVCRAVVRRIRVARFEARLERDADVISYREVV